jgi:hypothetical protein
MQVSRCCCGPGGCDPVSGYDDGFATFGYTADPLRGQWRGILNDPGSQVVRVFPAGVLEVLEQSVFSGYGWLFDRCANWSPSIVGMSHRLSGQYEAFEVYGGNYQGISVFSVFDNNQWQLTHALEYDSAAGGWRLQLILGYDPVGPAGSASAQSWLTGVLQTNVLDVPRGPWDFDLEVVHEQLDATQWNLAVANFGNPVLSVVTAPPNQSGPEWRHGFSSAVAVPGFSAQTTRIDRFSYIASTA